MPKIERYTLEYPMKLSQAEYLLNEFYTDCITYPEDEFRMRIGICKDLEEELRPLIRLAQSFWGIRKIHLLSKSNPGPDAIITFWWRRAAKIQITCSSENYNKALEREQILKRGILLLNQRWKRDKVTKGIVHNGGGVFEPSANVKERVKRILKAIENKERKYYTGTEILLIHEENIKDESQHDYRLHEQVCEKISERNSQYNRIYINYGDHIKRVK